MPEPYVPFDYNRDSSRRDAIIFGEGIQPEYSGGIATFNDLTLEVLDVLLAERFLDPKECQEVEPDAGTIIEFIRTRYPTCTVDGYVVSPDRHDYRVTIDSVVLETKITEAIKKEFRQVFPYCYIVPGENHITVFYG